MFSRMTTLVILHSAKRRAFIGSVPTKFRTIFSGTPNQQNYESKPIASPTMTPTFQSDNASEAIKIAVDQKLHEEEIAGQIQKILLQVRSLISEEIGDSTRGSTVPGTCMTKKYIEFFNVWKSRKEWTIRSSKRVDFKKAEDLFEQLAKKESAYRVPEFLLKDYVDCSTCSLDDLVHSKSLQNFYHHGNFVEANCCLPPIILKLLRDVTSELVVLHSLGIVHGDINPHNILIREGQRLFAKLVNFDGKALERLHQGSGTPAADLFKLGHVIGFCVSECSYQLAQPHEDILENKRNLTRAKYLPEAFHLMYSLLMTPRDTRLEAIDVLFHPLFWSPKKRVKFLSKIYEQIQSDMREIDSTGRSPYNSISSYIEETWAEEIGSIRLSPGSFEGLQRSLQYLRDVNIYYEASPNMWSQPPEDFEPFHGADAPLYRIVDDYYSRHYPWLFIYLYAVSYRTGGQQEEFEELFLAVLKEYVVPT